MDSGDFMRIAIGVFFLLFGIGLVVMLLRLAFVLRAAENMVRDLNREIVPVIARVQTTMDEANSELALVGEITERLVSAVSALEKIAAVLSQVAAGPAKVVGGAVSGIGAALSALVHSKEKERM